MGIKKEKAAFYLNYFTVKMQQTKLVVFSVNIKLSLWLKVYSASYINLLFMPSISN